MRPKIETARDALPALLRRYPGVRAAQLAALAQVSPATMVRILKEAGSGLIGMACMAAAPCVPWKR